MRRVEIGVGRCDRRSCDETSSASCCLGLDADGLRARQPDAQGRRFGVRGGVVRGPVIVRRGPVYGYPRGYYGYRRGYYGPGLGAAVGLGILGGAALGAAAAAPYYGYGGDPCLRQQQVIDAWGNAQWTYVRVC